jgi:hypothetical protein
MRYRAARRRPPAPGGATPLTARLCEERGAPLGPPQILRPSTPDSVTPTPIAEPAEGTLCRPQILNTFTALALVQADGTTAAIEHPMEKLERDHRLHSGAACPAFAAWAILPHRLSSLLPMNNSGFG